MDKGNIKRHWMCRHQCLSRRYIAFWDKETANRERLAVEPNERGFSLGLTKEKEEAGRGFRELVTYSGSRMVGQQRKPTHPHRLLI